MPNPSLFDYNLEFEALIDLLDNPTIDQETGEVQDSELLEEMFADLKLSASDKINNVQKFRLELENRAEGLKKLAKHYEEKAKVELNKANRMKEIMFSFVSKMDDKKFDSGEFKFSVSKGQPKVAIVDEENLPRAYRVAKWNADKNKIKEALKNGETIEGCSLEYSESLRVK